MQTKNKDGMKKAAVDQILVWMLLFVSFAIIFFFIMDYYSVIKTREKAAAITSYTARTVALEGISNMQVIADRVNAIKGGEYATVLASDISCVSPGTNNYKVTFTTIAPISSKFMTTNTLAETVGVFNEVSSDDIICTLTLSIS